MENDYKLKIGRNIMIARKEAGITQAELGDIIGMCAQAMSRYENGVDNISAARVYEISVILNVGIAEFFVDL